MYFEKAAMAELKTKKKNFSLYEQDLLVQQVKKHFTTHFGKFGPHLTVEDKGMLGNDCTFIVFLWGWTADTVNAKYKNIKSEVKTNMQQFKKAHWW